MRTRIDFKYGFLWTVGAAVTWDQHRRQLHVLLPFVSLMWQFDRPLPQGIDDAKIVDMGMTKNEFFMHLEGGAPAVMADAFAEELSQVGAENYVVVSFTSKKYGRIDVTVQRVEGKTPLDFLNEARAELERIKAGT